MIKEVLLGIIVEIQELIRNEIRTEKKNEFAKHGVLFFCELKLLKFNQLI